MNRKILIAIVASVGLTMFFACSQRNPKQEKAKETKVVEVEEEKAKETKVVEVEEEEAKETKVVEVKKENMEINGFTIITVDKDQVKIKIAAGKTLYDVALISGTQSFAFKSISNESGDLKMPSGATALAGSSLIHPESLGFDSYLFPDGAIVKVSAFGAAEGFKPEKIRIIPKKGAAAIEFSVKP